MRTMKFDIMKPTGGGERFVATLRYRWNDLFRFDFKAFRDWIEGQRPSLKGKPYNVYTDDDVVKVLYFNQDINNVLMQNR